MCWTAWQASISTGTPRACAAATMSCTGLIVPSAFETQGTETSLVRSEIRSISASSTSSPSSVTGATTTLRPI